jgi:hypothetical protein
MANEKILNTRIQLKIATYAEWTDESQALKGANFILKRGEIGLCEIPSGNTEATTAPTVLFKVGNGTNAFKDLKWASALAADVHAWAKKSETEFKEWAGTNIDTDTDTRYSFEKVDTKTDANYGKLKITAQRYNVKTSSNIGTAAVSYVDLVTPEELEEILKGYVKSVSGKEAIKSTGGQTPEISLALDNSGNVQFTQSDAGLKGNIDLSNFATKAEIPEIPTNHKILQTPVEDKITDKAHVLESLTQNANGDISYTVKKLTPEDIGAQPAGNYKTKQAPVADPTANGSALAFIDTISQNANGEITVTKKNITAADLGLSGAMHFLGVTTTKIEDNNTITTVSIAGKNVQAAAGDVVLYNNNELVFDGTKWHELGDGSSHALKTTTITGTDGLTGGGAIDQNRTISHAVPTGATAGEKIGTPGEGQRTYIKSVTTDKFGHITGYTTGTEEDQDLSGYKTKQSVVTKTGATNKTLTKIVQDANGEITEAVFEAIAITKSQVTDFEHDHDDKYQKLVNDTDIAGHYAIFDKNGQVVDGGFLSSDVTISDTEDQNYNSGVLGFHLYEKQGADDDASKENPIIGYYLEVEKGSGLNLFDTTLQATQDGTASNDNEGKFIQGKLEVANKGITTAKIADHAVGAAQIKAEQGYTGDDAEVWVFDCGGAE